MSATENVATEVSVRRNGGLAALVGALASAVAIAWLGRAGDTGAVLDWALFAASAAMGGYWLAQFFDARTPLLVADDQGVRLRLGKAWTGLPWTELAEVEHTPRAGLWRDGRLVLVPRDADAVLAELDAAGRRQVWWNKRLHHAELAVPLSLATRVPALSEDLTTSLRVLAGARTQVTEVRVARAPEPVVETDVVETESFAEAESFEPAVAEHPRPVAAATPSAWSEPVAEHDDVEDTDEIVLTPTPAPVRELRSARRSEVHSSVAPEGDDLVPDGRELRRPGSVSLVAEAPQAPRPLIAAPVEPIQIDDFAEPAPDPIIGPQLAAARTRLGLSVDSLAERTRIRPHVIEAIEVDDFHPCGGDFYARGHLRTLSRVLGVDVTPLLAAYDETYADAPIDPRRVFEAELATGSGGIRSTRGGPNWSVLVAAVMAVVLAWSIARLAMDRDTEVQNPAASLSNGSTSEPSSSAGVANVTAKITATASTSLKVVNAKGRVVFAEDVLAGDVHRLDVTPPFKVTVSDGAAVTVMVDGVERGTVGPAGKKVTKIYRSAR
ncbi:RodZ domain-containing protein [Nocardioides dubius]|uniref:Cytoskeleton protein RodZ-like C-terminal domain-containing protein n=1 Tax=Nocardioides dubius TaxID=317019 RepID=A0ABN1U2T9_9ACTN